MTAMVAASGPARRAVPADVAAAGKHRPVAAPGAAGLADPPRRSGLLPQVPGTLGGQVLRAVRMHGCLLVPGRGFRPALSRLALRQAPVHRPYALSRARHES